MAHRTLYKAASCSVLLLVLVSFNAFRWDQSSSKVSPTNSAVPSVNLSSANLPHGSPIGRSLLSESAECRDIHKVDGNKEKCQFLSDTASCGEGGGFFNYNHFIYCELGDVSALAITIVVLWWLFAFIGLAVCADDFFCPSLLVISKTLHLSPNVAGVTFLAFGNGAPDFFSAITALGNDSDPGLAVGGLFGAGMFVTTVVVGTISVVKPFKAMERPFLRDIIFYMAAVYWVFLALWRQKIYIFETIGLIAIYVFYVITVIVSGAIYKKQKTSADSKGVVVLQRVTSTDINKSHEAGDGEVNKAFDADTKPAAKTSSDDIYMIDREEKPRPKYHREASMGNIGVMDVLPNGEIMQLDDLAQEKEKDAEEKSVVAVDAPWWKQLLDGLNPINVNEWSEMAWYAKAYDIFKSPLMFVITLTCPLVDYNEEENHNWNKYLQCVQMFLSPVISTLLIKVGFISIAGGFQMYMLMLLVGAGLSILVFFTSKPDTKPVYHSAFGFFGFFISLVWIYVIANEIVSILETFGVVFNISNAILGLTLLAWGNSVGDWISNSVMARQGFARMGFAACFGAPLFNLCLGFGIPHLFQMLSKNVTDLPLSMSPVTLILAVFLLSSICLSLIFLPLVSFKVNRYYGIVLLVLYLVFLVTALLTEANIFLANFEIPTVPKAGL